MASFVRTGLQRHPYLGNSCLGALVMGLGDVGAQAIEHARGGRGKSEETGRSSEALRRHRSGDTSRGPIVGDGGGATPGARAGPQTPASSSTASTYL